MLIAGKIYFKVDGKLYQGKGDFEYNLGNPKREGMMNSSQETIGYKESGVIAEISGNITVMPDMNQKDFDNITDATVTLEVPGKTIVLYNAWNASDHKTTTGEMETAVVFQGRKAEEILK